MDTALSVATHQVEQELLSMMLFHIALSQQKALMPKQLLIYNALINTVQYPLYKNEEKRKLN